MLNKTVFLLAALLVFVACTRGPQAGDVQNYTLQWQTVVGGTAPQGAYPFDKATTDTAAYVLGTAVDTSKAFQVERYMAATVSLQDTAAGGTAASVTYKLYVANESHLLPGRIPAFSRFALADEFTVGYETSKDTLWVFSNYGPAKYGYITATGQAGNNATTPTQSVIRIGYDEGGW